MIWTRNTKLQLAAHVRHIQIGSDRSDAEMNCVIQTAFKLLHTTFTDCCNRGCINAAHTTICAHAHIMFVRLNDADDGQIKWNYFIWFLLLFTLAAYMYIARANNDYPMITDAMLTLLHCIVVANSQLCCAQFVCLVFTIVRSFVSSLNDISAHQAHQFTMRFNAHTNDYFCCHEWK